MLAEEFDFINGFEVVGVLNPKFSENIIEGKVWLNS
jgi:hypothetical protein